MTYLDTMNALYPAWSWIAWILAAILGIGGTAILLNELSSKGRIKVIASVLMAICLAAYLGCAPYIDLMQSHQSMDNLKANIKAKYNVQDIVADYPKRNVKPTATSQEVVVITPQNQTVIFVLQQDPKTFEPTLLDSAIQSGTVPSGAVTVKDITR